MNKLFALGQVVVTRGINYEISENLKFARFVYDSLTKHANGDFGCLCEEDKQMNMNAIANGDDRIFSKYKNSDGEAIYIITEWDRSCTTILFPSEY